MHPTVDWGETKSAIISKVDADLVEVVVNSAKLWLPANMVGVG